MKRCIGLLVSLLLATQIHADPELRPSLETTYQSWRQAMVQKNLGLWQRVTAEHRQVEVANRVLSEKRPYPAAIFDLPAPPPALTGLTFLEATQNGPTAKLAYFGKIDFGVGGTPTDNLLVLAFVRGGKSWLYDRADFVNLAALPEVRAELAAGNLKYLHETPEARPDGQVPPTPIRVGPAKIIAKVYAFCPGREVKVQINKVSRHRFANAKEAEIVIGGAVEGSNEVQFTTQNLAGATGNEAMTLRVYLMSTTPGTKPIKIFEYQVAEGERAQSVGSANFIVDRAVLQRLAGK